MHRASLLVIALLQPLTASHSPLGAQQTAFERLRDSIAASSDTALLQRELRDARRGSDRQPVLPTVIRAGLIGLRLGELRADADFSSARSSFRRATKLAPQRAEAWYGLGLTEAAR